MPGVRLTAPQSRKMVSRKGAKARRGCVTDSQLIGPRLPRAQRNLIGAARRRFVVEPQPADPPAPSCLCALREPNLLACKIGLGLFYPWSGHESPTPARLRSLQPAASPCVPGRPRRTPRPCQLRQLHTVCPACRRLEPLDPVNFVNFTPLIQAPPVRPLTGTAFPLATSASLPCRRSRLPRFRRVRPSAACTACGKRPPGRPDGPFLRTPGVDQRCWSCPPCCPPPCWRPESC